MKEKKKISIKDLLPDPKNPRKHSEENIEAIKKSLKTFGPARSVVIDANGIVRAGNGTLQAALELGLEKVAVVEVDENTVVAVRRKDWTEEQAVGYSIADNRTAELADWDRQTLEGALDCLSHPILDSLGFSEKDLEDVLKDLSNSSENTDFEVFAPDYQEEEKTKFTVICLRSEASKIKEILERLTIDFDGCTLYAKQI